MPALTFEAPAPVGHPFEQQPDRPPQSAGQMGHHAVAADDQIAGADDRRRIEEGAADQLFGTGAFLNGKELQLGLACTSALSSHPESAVSKALQAERYWPH